MRAIQLVASFLVFSTLFLPNWNTPFGRLSLEAFFLAILIIPLAVTGRSRILPALFLTSLPALASSISIAANSYLHMEQFPPEGIRYIGSYLRNSLYFAGGVYLGSRLSIHELSVVRRVFLVTSVLIFLIAVLQVFSEGFSRIIFNLYWDDPALDLTFEDVEHSLTNRPASTLRRVFAFSFFSVVVFLSLIYTSFKSMTLKVRFGAAFLALVCIVISQTKGAVLALIVSLFVLFFSRRAPQRSLAIVLALAGFIGFVALSVYEFDMRRGELFLDVLAGNWDEVRAFVRYSNSFQNRWDYIQLQLQIFYTNPFMGDFPAAVFAFGDNLYANVLATVGLLGLTSIFVMAVYLLQLSNRVLRMSRYRTLSPRNADTLAFFGSIVWFAVTTAFLMGVTWNLFAGNKAIAAIFLIAGLLEGFKQQMSHRDLVRSKRSAVASNRFHLEREAAP